MYAPWYHAVQAFFQRAQHGGDKVPVVFAGPDRAHEEIKRVMRRRLQGKARPRTDQQLSDRKTQAPFMSVSITGPKFNPDLYNPGRFKVSEDRASGTATVARWPRPMQCSVQVDLWSANDGGGLIAMNITGQIELQFPANRVHLPIDWSDPRWFKPPFNILGHAKTFGRTRITLTDGGWEDNSDLEFGDNPKDVRFTWTGDLLGYLPYPPQEARLVRTIRYALYDMADETTPLIEQTSGRED